MEKKDFEFYGAFFSKEEITKKRYVEKYEVGVETDPKVLNTDILIT